MCTYKSREDLLSRIEEKDGIIEKLKKKLSKCERMLSETEETCVGLQTRLDYVETKLKVYDAFFRDSRNGPRPDFVVDDAEVDGDNSSYKATDLQRLSRLQHLSSLSVSNTADSK
jgi:predicted nuclease with TOPRIM domain